MDTEPDFLTGFGQVRESRDWDGDIVSYPAGLDDGLVGMLLDQYAAQ
jgi:hypothetical protein